MSAGEERKGTRVTFLDQTGAKSVEAVIAYGDGGAHCADIDVLTAAARTAAARGSVLVKGSRFMRLERVVAALVASGDGSGQGAGGH